MSQRVIVVGGGVAGLAAAGRAAELGADVVVLEKGARLGRKLLLTGNGHCNLTNNCPPVEFIKHLGPTGAFMRNALARFGAEALCNFMHHLGVPTIINPDGRVFPASLSSRDVLAALVNYNLRYGVRFAYNCAVEALDVRDGAVLGAITRAESCGYPAEAVILATGGKSWAQTGSSGDGYSMLESLGHRIVKPLPGLVPLVVAEGWIRSMEGVALPLVRITAMSDKQRLARCEGEILFTSDGLSGPAVLNLSSRITNEIAQGPVQLIIDLFPQVTADALEAQLSTEILAAGSAEMATILQSHLPRRLAQVIISLASHTELAGNTNAQDGLHFPAKQVTSKQRRYLVELCKRLPLTVLATRPFNEAMVTVGGVSCDEVDPLTFASKRIKGLYVAGELLDVAGDSGGYNLQVAFTSGRLAGEGAIRKNG